MVDFTGLAGVLAFSSFAGFECLEGVLTTSSFAGFAGLEGVLGLSYFAGFAGLEDVSDVDSDLPHVGGAPTALGELSFFFFVLNYPDRALFTAVV